MTSKKLFRGVFGQLHLAAVLQFRRRVQHHVVAALQAGQHQAVVAQRGVGLQRTLFDAVLFADDEGHPVARVGLRSLRDERAPDSSLKSTLEALRKSGQPEKRPSGVRTFLIWALVGGAIAAVVAWYLFFR